MSDEFWERYKDPRWQKKRLEVMQRDNFTCQHCGAKTQELHVHHGHYERGFAPWEYENWMLTTLCKSCHEEAERLVKMLRSTCSNLRAELMMRVIGYAWGLVAKKEGGVPTINDDDYVLGLSDSLGVSLPITHFLMQECLVADRSDIPADVVDMVRFEPFQFCG